MEPLITMVKYGRIECLSHPLCEILLQRKWSKYGLPIYGLTTLFYLIFLLVLTSIIILYPNCFNYDFNEDSPFDQDLNITECKKMTDNYYVRLKN